MPNDMEEPYVLHSIFFFFNCTHSSLESVAAISETITSGKLSAANDCLKYLIVEDDVAEYVMCTSIHLECASHL